MAVYSDPAKAVEWESQMAVSMGKWKAACLVDLTVKMKVAVMAA